VTTNIINKNIFCNDSNSNNNTKFVKHLNNNISDYNILNNNDIKSTILNSNDIKKNNDNNHKNNEETNIILNRILMHGSNSIMNISNNKGNIIY